MNSVYTDRTLESSGCAAMEDDIVEAKNLVFLNLVVQKVEPSNIQMFMRSWMKQQCKDFRVVFLHDPKTASKEEKEAVAYAKRYTEVFNLQDNIQIVGSCSQALPSQQTRFLKDTSILPTDKLEILKLKSSNQSQKTTKVLATANPLLKDFEVPIKTQFRNQKSSTKQPKLQKTQILSTNKAVGSDDDVTVAMATQPCRVDSYVNVVYQLLPQCTRMCICFNGFDNIPDNLPKSSKIIAICANGKNGNPPDLGCDNKMYWLGDFPGYYATVDDDIIYPSNYIKVLKDGVDRYAKEAIVSFHGHRYDSSGKISTQNRTLLWYKNKHSTEYCHRLGMGVAMSFPSKIGLTKDVFLNHPKNTGDDELMALWAQNHHIPLICLSTYQVDIKSNDNAAMKNPLSSGNSTIRKRKNLLENYTKWSINELKSKSDLTIAMATQPHRCRQMLNVVKMLLPYCTRFCIALNCYDAIPSELNKLAINSKKITIMMTGNNSGVADLGNLNKMYWLGDFPGYYATVDDDLAYSKKYLDTLIYHMKMFGNKAICTYHGLQFNVDHGIVDLSSKQIIFYNRKNPKCQACLRPGMGTAMMNPQEIGISKELYLSKPKGYSDDIITSIFAQQHNIPCMVVKHEDNDVVATDFAFTGLYKDARIQQIRANQMLAYKNWKYNWA